MVCSTIESPETKQNLKFEISFLLKFVHDLYKYFVFVLSLIFFFSGIVHFDGEFCHYINSSAIQSPFEVGSMFCLLQTMASRGYISDEATHDSVVCIPSHVMNPFKPFTPKPMIQILLTIQEQNNV